MVSEFVFYSIKFITDNIKYEIETVQMYLGQLRLFQAAQMSFRMNLPVVLYLSNHSWDSIWSKLGLLEGFLSRILLIRDLS